MKNTHTAEEYLWFNEEQAFENVATGIWNLTTFKEWFSVIVAEHVKNTAYQQTTVKMLEDD